MTPTQAHPTINSPRLSFHGGRFRIEGVAGDRNIRLSKDPYWTCLAQGTYETVSLRAAAALRRFATPYVENKIFARAFQAHYDLPAQPPLPPELDVHQVEGVRWVLERKRSYLAHAPGAGKTAQAIVAAVVALAQSPGRVLFVVPPTLTVNWVKEIWKVTSWMGVWPTIGVVPLSADREDMAWRAEFIVCPDSMLSKPWVYEKLSSYRWKLVAVDEASRFKESSSERSIAFYGGRKNDRAYPGLFQDARHVVFLDGSPMPNRPMELWAPTYALHPEAIDCMDQDDFGYRYCGARPNERGQWEYLHSSHEDELREKLQADFMHVVTEAQLSHPERLRKIVYLAEDVRSHRIKTWERRSLEGLLAGELDEEASQGEVAAIRRELGVAKIPQIEAYTRMMLEKNERILLFVWHREVAETIMADLTQVERALVIGGTPPAVRETAFTAFQSGRKQLLVMNIAAAGRGHNLQAATRVIFGEYSWGDEANKQCEHRTARRGNDALEVPCDYLVVPNSFDERVLSSVFTKEKRVRRIIG